MYDHSEGDGYESSGDEEGLVGALRAMALGGRAKPGLQRPRMPRLSGLARGAAPTGEEPGPATEPSPRSSSSEEEGPDLGEDIVTIRLRAKACAAGPLPPAPAACAINFDELRRYAQVDLNDEENLRDLEDPRLVEHMRQRREERAAHEAARAALPPKEALRREDAAGRRALSALTTQLKEQQMALQCASDEVHAHAANAGKLAVGVQPHGYPDRSDAQASFGHLKKKLLAAVTDLGGVIAALEDFERDLALARRHYETVVYGLSQWCEHHREEAALRPSEPGWYLPGDGEPAGAQGSAPT